MLSRVSKCEEGCGHLHFNLSWCEIHSDRSFPMYALRGEKAPNTSGFNKESCGPLERVGNDFLGNFKTHFPLPVSVLISSHYHYMTVPHRDSSLPVFEGMRRTRQNDR